jgi:hypothetical protein
LPSHLAKPARARGWWGGRAQQEKSRKQGSNLRLARRMRPPLYRLSYSAVLQACALHRSMSCAHVSVAAPLGFEPSRPSSKPGALPARRRGNAMVPRAGFEPAPSDLKDRRPRPLDERGNWAIGNRQSNLCSSRLPIAYCRLPKVVSVDGFEPPISCSQGRRGRPGSPTRCCVGQ